MKRMSFVILLLAWPFSAQCKTNAEWLERLKSTFELTDTHRDEVHWRERCKARGHDFKEAVKLCRKISADKYRQPREFPTANEGVCSRILQADATTTCNAFPQTP